jgi:acetyl-CoA carboxylase biotin carboxyl carrier protein
MSKVEVKSEIPGSVVRIEVNVGDSVAEDDAIVMLESMKMEIPVSAPIGGKIVEILVNEGEPIAEGQLVAVLET